jgi:hypothetical protein
LESQVVVTSTKDKSQSFSYSASLVRKTICEKCYDEKRWLILESILKYKSSDILIISYPKCGTTWTEQCILLLLADGNRSALNPATKNTYVPLSQAEKVGKIWPEASLEQFKTFATIMPEAAYISLAEFDNIGSSANSLQKRRVIKSHAPVSNLLGCQQQGLMGLPDGMKVIVVTRNPFDAW